MGKAGVIAVIATVDTKEKEAFFLRDHIRAHGFGGVIIDVSTRDSGQARVEYPWREVAAGVGVGEAALAAKRRDDMMRTMGEGAGKILLDLYAKGALAGAVSVGGNQGTAIAAIAMRQLPIGVPKIIVSTVASGQIRPYVEYRDIMMMFSVADFVNNVNRVNRAIMANAAGAVMGMARMGLPLSRADGGVVAATAFGNTDAAVSRAGRELAGAGYEVVCFHASGAGGSAMEYLIERGFIHGVLDLTTHELLAEVCGCGDIYTPLRPRLVEAGRAGIPQVVAPGALEYFCFGGADTIPASHRDRPTHYHNPYNTNVRATREEGVKAGEALAAKVNASTGPVAVLLPARGFSENGRSGGSLHQPEIDQAIIEAIRTNLRAGIDVEVVDANINDPEFSALAAAKLLAMLGGRRG
ncbi:MAG: Tm-1-like ATP-binding domain-containing protein [Planctomycetota bacterium]|jgi:uncharacterized protein (UPF0261 family)|nr:Tm-1-like ATP-binding domain-containing protein [Planctomycetota bacterium]